MEFDKTVMGDAARRDTRPLGRPEAGLLHRHDQGRVAIGKFMKISGTRPEQHGGTGVKSDPGHGSPTCAGGT